MVESGFLEARVGIVGPNRDWEGCWRIRASVDSLRDVGYVGSGGGYATAVLLCRHQCCRCEGAKTKKAQEK